MTEHIKEAIELNKKRMLLYAALTNGKSLRFSRKLIAIEYLSLLMAMYIDKRAIFFHKHDVRIVATDFVSMKQASAFYPSFGEEINFEKPIEDFDVKKLRRRLWESINENDFKRIGTLCDKTLIQLSKQAHHYGLFRHLIESITRIAYLAPFHDEQCEIKSIRSSIPLSKRLLQLHLIILGQAYDFDNNVAFIQNKGIPFVIQDMPHIKLENPY